MFIKQCVFEYFLTPDQKLNENPAGVRLIHLPAGLIIDSFSTKNRITNNYLIFETESFGLVRGRLINKN